MSKILCRVPKYTYCIVNMLPFYFRSRLDYLPTTARFFSMKFQAQGSEAGVARIKHNKIPRKLASKVMHELRWEQVQNPLPFPKFRVGDAVEVKMLPYKSASAAVVMRGVVLSKVFFFIAFLSETRAWNCISRCCRFVCVCVFM